MVQKQKRENNVRKSGSKHISDIPFERCHKELYVKKYGRFICNLKKGHLSCHEDIFFWSDNVKSDKE